MVFGAAYEIAGNASLLTTSPVQTLKAVLAFLGYTYIALVVTASLFSWLDAKRNEDDEPICQQPKLRQSAGAAICVRNLDTAQP